MREQRAQEKGNNLTATIKKYLNLSPELTYQFCKTAKQLSGSSSIAQTILNNSLSIFLENQIHTRFLFQKIHQLCATTPTVLLLKLCWIRVSSTFNELITFPFSKILKSKMIIQVYRLGKQPKILRVRR